MIEARVKHWLGELDRYSGGTCPWNEAFFLARLTDVTGPEAVIDARVQKAILTEVKAKLDADPAWNQDFVAAPEWKILHQLLTAARLRELTRVKIVKRGRTSGVGFQVTELAATFYGRQILDGLGYGKRRSVLDRDEFARVTAEFQKIKLTLPEAVEPTFTERFFGTREEGT